MPVTSRVMVSTGVVGVATIVSGEVCIEEEFGLSTTILETPVKTPLL
jgi:hypothetical protein